MNADSAVSLPKGYLDEDNGNCKFNIDSLRLPCYTCRAFGDEGIFSLPQ